MADSPKQAEAAQALFCAVADLRGKKLPTNFKTFSDGTKKDFESTFSKDFAKVQSQVITTGIPLSAVKAFLTVKKSDSTSTKKLKDEWFVSSVNVANRFYETATKISRSVKNHFTTKGIKLFYLRDDKEIMNGLKILFAKINKAVAERNARENVGDLIFNDLNKWSPADIYFATKKARGIFRQLTTGKGKLEPALKIGKFRITGIQDFVTFNILNILIGKLIKDGDLLPLSLKKAPKDVKIKTFNIVKNDIQKNLEDKGIEYSGYIFAQKAGQVFDSKDIKIKINADKLRIKFRDKGSSGYTKNKAPTYSYQGIVEGGAQSFDGGLGGGSIFDVIAAIITPGKATDFRLQNQNKLKEDAIKIGNLLTPKKGAPTTKQINAAISVNTTIADSLKTYCRLFGKKSFASEKEMYKELANTEGYRVGDLDSKRRKMTQGLASREKTQWIWSKYMGGNLISLIENNEMGKDIVKAMVLYATSRTTSSSPHYKAADPSSL